MAIAKESFYGWHQSVGIPKQEREAFEKSLLERYLLSEVLQIKRS